MTYDELAALALELPGTEEDVSMRGACVMREKNAMLWTKGKEPLFVLKMDWDSHDRFLAANPEAVYKTKHYEGYPAVQLRLDHLHPALAKEMLAASWQDAPNKPSKRPTPRAS